MERPSLSEKQVNHLLNLLKLVAKKHIIINLGPGERNHFDLIDAGNNYKFRINYFVARSKLPKMSIHIQELTNNIGLFRINIDPIGFHKNSDGVVYGNRMMQYSLSEWDLKNDSCTYFRALPLPSKYFPMIDSLIDVFQSFLEYTNVRKDGSINFGSTLF
ncbi:hypothetical protein NIE88_18600 [Sporolactobacillus shoreicorticis]|uniref:DUF6978 family protein n=1 Tax=Sporolactobacillus shoreicorticis TaxID=1923877 RepID=A0ABW5S567_9BACL|nr:hypothetical protein [Sporolactobacillus shoreicorticis]MCO7127759.1 hypothetical protein [Sporolactobacillus shoreicorticis]